MAPPFAAPGPVADGVNRPKRSPGIRAAELLALGAVAAAGLVLAAPAAAIGILLGLVVVSDGSLDGRDVRRIGRLLGRPSLGTGLGAGLRFPWIVSVVAACGVVCWLGARDELGRGLIYIPAIAPFLLLTLTFSTLLFGRKR